MSENRLKVGDLQGGGSVSAKFAHTVGNSEEKIIQLDKTYFVALRHFKLA